ncbi:hypothetical protein [Alkalibacter mobilis]|uniref:hypothetical protein n=1 Tax=Alkalibacter mobilis TaxID=2787712 RepID=UPI00189EE612|nr:hypothetical protein [Alkalibacter mobilis]MBF7095916.1 hypothetical protein [Alkalibacter mobilis]
MKKLILLPVWVLIVIFISGCTPFFIKENEPVILSNNGNTVNSNVHISSDRSANLQIESINSKLTSGIVWDISKDGSYLLTSKQVDAQLKDSILQNEKFLNMSIYDIETGQSNPPVYSNKNQVNGRIDLNNDGYVYLETTSADQIPNLRLVWSDNTGDTTKNLSSSNESVSIGYSMVNENTLVYANNRSEITLVDLDKAIAGVAGANRTYKLSKKLTIIGVDLWEKENMAVFSTYDDSTKTYDLYIASLNKKEVAPVLIDSNIRYFTLSKEQGQILYTLAGEKDTQRLILYDLASSTGKLLKEGYIGLFSFSNSGDKLIFSERNDPSSNSQNLWLMKTDGTDSLQLASNLNVYGYTVVFHPKKDSVYFTVFEINDANTDNRKISYTVYSIDYNAS